MSQAEPLLHHTSARKPSGECSDYSRLEKATPLTLPTEIWWLICEFNECKLMCAVGTPLLFTKVILDSSHERRFSTYRACGGDQRMGFLKAITRGETELSRHVHCLEITHSGAVGAAPHCELRKRDMSRQSVMLSVLSRKSTIRRPRFRLPLSNRHCHAERHRPEGGWYPDIWRRSSEFQNLQRLSLKGCFDSVTVETLLSANPSITHLELGHFREQVFRIQDAFRLWGQSSPRLQMLNIDCLRTSSFCGHICDEEAVTLLPFLRRLRSLRIANIYVSNRLWEDLVSSGLHIQSLDVYGAKHASLAFIEHTLLRGNLEKGRE
ncbi:hypothetical protein CPB85DRAFT_1459331 [Mucidula mucida]|nr:hypothetical protein CPB85DRAFT_1459331 [Mucidula mucida]